MQILGAGFNLFYCFTRSLASGTKHRQKPWKEENLCYFFVLFV